MSKLIRSPKARVALFTLFLFGVFLTAFLYRQALAAPYANPFWANNSGAPESAIAMVADRAMIAEGKNCNASTCGVHVDARTGELFFDLNLFRTPGVLDDNRFAVRWRSMIGGSSQLGNGMLPSWETTAQYVLLLPATPNAPSGHAYDIRKPTGRIDRHVYNGAGAYTSPADVFDTVTINGAGNVVLTDKWGNSITFDNLGMPNLYTDRNGNVDTATYDAMYRMTGHVDERGKIYTTTQNINNYMASLADPFGRGWNFGYDLADNLNSVTTPTTPDQPTGINIGLNYDGLNRLTGVNDGRGNTVFQFAYVGATGKIATVTINGNAVQYTYLAGTTTRTDRNGNVENIYFIGQQVTKTETMVAAAPKYVELHRYGAIFPSNTVHPRGDRVDWVFDAVGNLTQRRRRTTDTAINDPSDLVENWGYNANFKVSYTDPLGNVWTYGRDGAGNLTGTTHPAVTNPSSQTASNAWTRNAKGQPTKFTDEEGNETIFAYFGAGANNDLLKENEQDPSGSGLSWTFTYDAAGNIATANDPNGKIWTFTWDNLRRLTQGQAPPGLSYKVKYKYDGNHNPTTKDVENIDKDGNSVATNPWITTGYAFTNTDDLSVLTEEIDASTNRTTTFDYDANQNRIRITKPEGNKEKWEYNERDWVIKHIRGETDPKASETEYQYDENGNRTVFEDGRNNQTTTVFDAFDRRIKAINALGHYTEWTLDAASNVTKIQKKDSSNAELQRATYSYDERNRRWKIEKLFKDPSATHPDAVTIIERLKTNHAKKVTDPNLNDTTYTYDAALRVTKIADMMGNEWTYTLDGNGNRTAWSIKEIDGAGSVTHDYEATYDVLNRRTTRVEIDRNTTSNKWTTTYAYDSRSNLVFEINAEGNPTRWTFDALDRMTKREQALTLGATINDFTTAQVTQWAYDTNDRLTSHKDDGPNESTWAYDALDRATTMTYPDSTTVAYVHDDADNVTKTTDPSGNVVDDTFDAINRNTSRSITLVSSFLGTTSETRTFDAVNRMATNQDNDYKLEFEYAVIGLDSYVYEETQSYVGMTAYPKTVTKTFDGNGNKVTEAYPAGANLSLTYVYNNIDRLTSIGDGTNTIASYSWIGLRKKSATYQNNATRTNTYTGFRNELGTVHHQTSTPNTILQLDYAYNKVHDKTYERYGGSGSAGDAFAYDKMRRLTNAWMGSVTPSAPVGAQYVTKIDYNYDDDGNRTSVVTTPWAQTAVTTSYTTNNLNEYTAVGTTTHVWDANGNLTDNGTFLFKYDYKNLIVQVKLKSDSSLVASYRYDALGRRVEKNLGDVERYIRSTVIEPGDRDNISHVVAVYDGSDNWLQNFVWNDETDGIQMLEQKDVLDYDTDGNTAELTRSFYHRNALGSVMEITDLNQAGVVSYRYDPYGKVAITRGGTPQTNDPLGQHWTFTARFLDEESDLYYYRARFYDPGTGRFTARDALGYSAGPNLFAYAGSSPATLRDPSGHDKIPPADGYPAPYGPCMDCHPGPGGYYEKGGLSKEELFEALLNIFWDSVNQASPFSVPGTGSENEHEEEQDEKHDAESARNDRQDETDEELEERIEALEQRVAELEAEIEESEATEEDEATGSPGGNMYPIDPNVVPN